jgi:hypothetical protein
VEVGRLLVMVASALVVSSSAAPAQGAPWRVTTIGRYGRETRLPQVVVDRAGIVHIVSTATVGFGATTYHTNASGSFAEEDFPGRDAGARPFLTLDAQRDPVLVSAPPEDSFSPTYYRKIDGAWLPTAVPLDVSFVGGIAFDGANHAHVLSFGECAPEECSCNEDEEVGVVIRHATDAGGSWTSEVVLAECRPFGVEGRQDVVLAADARGAAHAVWLDAGMRQVAYATNAGGPWATTVLADVGEDTRAWDHPLDLALDGAGRPHVVYYNDRDPDVFITYAANDGGGWQQARIAGRAVYPALAVDAPGNVHVFFDDPFLGKNEVRYAFHAAGSAVGAWSIKRLAQARGDAPGDIALDAAGRLYLAFYEPLAQALRFATRGKPGGGGIPGQLSGETAAVQVSNKPEIALTCVRATPGAPDVCLAEGFASSGGGAVAVARIELPVTEGAAGGPRVTKTARKRFRKTQRATRFKLRLNPIGKRLLKQSPSGALDVEIRVRLKSGGDGSLLSRLVTLVRSN